MSAPVDALGPAAGPRVVLLHGIGLGPWSMADAARRLARRNRVLVMHRRGYGRAPDRAAGTTMADDVTDLLRVLDAADAARAVVAGVGAGASIALAAAIAHPERIAGVVAHEPEVGPLAPGAHGLVSAGIGALEQAGDPAHGVETIALMLLGARAFGALAPSARAALREAGPAVAVELAVLASFAPTPAELARLAALPVVSSVGALSRPQRHEAARVLAVRARADLVVVPRCGHLVQTDAPVALARAVGTVQAPR